MRHSTHFLLMLSLCSSVAMAAGSTKDLIQFEVKLSSQESDNALRAHNNPLQERQDMLGATINANLENDWSDLSSRYDLGRWYYAENSMPDYTQIEGRTALMLGKAESPVGLALSHSRHSTLTTPDAVDVSANRDERTILSAEPWLNWRVDGNDNVRLNGIYSEVDFQKDETKNIKEKGAALSWGHKISKTDRFGLSVESTKNTYLFAPDFDYDYRAVLANYAVQLNHISYSLFAGENQAKQINQNSDVKSPMYKAELSYKSSANEVGFYAGQSITNTSNGNGNREGLGMFSTQGTESAKDLIRLREAEVFWETKSLCALCNLHLGVGYLNNDYNRLPDDENQTRVTASFRYQLTRAASVNLGVRRAKHSFAELSLRTDYTEQTSDISLDYKFAKSATVKVYLRNESRDAIVDLQNYVEKIVGASVAISF